MAGRRQNKWPNNKKLTKDDDRPIYFGEQRKNPSQETTNGHFSQNPQNNGDKITSGRKYANKRLNEILITRLKWSGTRELRKQKRETHKTKKKTNATKNIFKYAPPRERGMITTYLTIFENVRSNQRERHQKM